MPDGLRTEKLYVFTIPVETSLGVDELDYSCVGVEEFEYESLTICACAGQIFYVSTGKLGVLIGGMVHVPDVRTTLTSEQIVEVRLSALHAILGKKRRGMEN